MTALEPQVMVSRQVSKPAADDQYRMAQAIAKAGDMLPRSYREKPGAVLLVMQWAKSRDVDVLTAIQTVSFIEGRPVIDATMQRALAQRAGYRVEITEASRESASVRVFRESDLLVLGSSTYTMEDARTAGLAGKKNWQQNPEDMLVARATTRALKRCAPDVMLGLITQDEAEEVDTVSILASEPDGPAEDTTTAPAETPALTPAATEPDTEDAEIVFGINEFKSLIRQASHTQRDAIEKAQEIAQSQGIDPPASLDSILCADTVLPLVVAWLNAEVDTLGEEPF